jgi:hypothetical protein
MHGSLVSK